LISWKRSYETVSNELELVKRKKQALDGLFNTGRISQSTYDYLNKDITEALKAIEQDFKALMEKMTTRATEIEKQLNSLEIFLADLEIHYAAGEIDEEPHRRQADAISLGLEATEQELDALKDLLSRRILEAAPPPPPPAPAPAVSPPPAEVASLAPAAPLAPLASAPPVQEGRVEDLSTEIIQEAAPEEGVEAVSGAVIEEKLAEESTTPQEIPAEGVEKTPETVVEEACAGKIETPVEEAIEEKAAEVVAEEKAVEEGVAVQEKPMEEVEKPLETVPEETLTEKIETPTEEKIGETSLEEVAETTEAPKEAPKTLAQNETPEVTELPAETKPSE